MTRFRVATAADDALLRRLLRDNGMPGWVEMCLEREPSFLAGQGWLGPEWAVLAEEGTELVGMYTACVMPVYANGVAERVGYLGGLRVQPAHRRRIRHLREGYASIPRLAPVQPSLPWWFTVVAGDNAAARRLLEAGLPGLPRYRPIGAYATYALPAARGQPGGLWRPIQPQEIAALLAWRSRLAARCHLAAELDEALLHRIGIGAWWLHEGPGGPLAMAALWDQRAHKQVVARRYRGGLHWALPAYNAWARVARRIPLPRPGTALAHSAISFLTLEPTIVEDTAKSQALIADLLARCTTPIATLGLHGVHPWVPLLKRFKAMDYPAQVYAVEFDAPAQLDDRPVQPEAALL